MGETEKEAVALEEMHKELDLIQGCITRMAQNSFMIKGWVIGILAAMIAIAGDRIPARELGWISMAILLAFWALDAFFLKMEKCYRFKYEWVIDVRPKGNRNSLYDLNPYKTETRKGGVKTPGVLCVMFSRPFTLLMFYGIPFLIAVAAIVMNPSWKP